MSRAPARTITNEAPIYSVAFTTNGKNIVGGGEGNWIREWRVEGSHQVGPIMLADGTVLAVVVSNNGRWIITGDAGNRTIVWNARTHEQDTVMRDHTNWVRTVDVSNDSTRIASGSYDKSVRILSITGQNLILPLQHDHWVVAVKFSPTGDRIATATLNRSSVRVYDSYTGESLFDIQVQVKSYPITPFAWSHDGQRLFTASPRKITCLDTSTSLCSEWSIQSEQSQVSIGTNGKFIACSAGSSVSFWDPISHEEIGNIIQCPSTISCITFSPDGRYLACGYGNSISFHRLDEILPNSYVQPLPSRPPLMEVSTAALISWLKQDDGDQDNTETILSEEIGRSATPNHYTLANRALIRTHLEKWNAAIEDADMSLQINPSPIGHIARALALLGMGDKNLALSHFDFAFCICDPNDVKFLFLIKSIVVFCSGSHEDAIYRISGLITNVDENARYYCLQVLGYMYLKKGDYEGAIRSLRDLRSLADYDEIPQLTTISLIFGWNFCGLKAKAWTNLCETLYASGRMKEVGETLLDMVSSLAENEREVAHCRILEEIVTRSGDVTLLSWTGHSSAYNTCLPASPAVYAQSLFTPPTLEGEEMEIRTLGLRRTLSQFGALMMHDRVTRLQPVRFANRRLLLPCLVFHVRSLSKEEANAYRARAAWLGDIEFTTEDKLPLKAPQRLVFVHPWIRRLCGPCYEVTPQDDFESDVGVDAEIMHAPLVEEAPSDPSDAYMRALQLIARFSQPFNALLLLKQPDGTYKRVATEKEIVVQGHGCNDPKDIHAEVLEVV